MITIRRRPVQFKLHGATYYPPSKDLFPPKQILTEDELGFIKHDNKLRHSPKIESILRACDRDGYCSYKYGNFSLRNALVLAVHYITTPDIEPAYQETDVIRSDSSFRDKEVLSLLEGAFNPIRTEIHGLNSEELNIYGLNGEYVTLSFREFVRLKRPKVIREDRTIISRFKKN